MDTLKERIFVFDIDGTLADHQGVRGPFEEHKVAEDKVIEPVAEVLRALAAYRFKIIYVSGRSEACRKDTEWWLRSNILNHMGSAITLFMRQKGDHRNDAIVKKEIYDNHILDKYEVLGVFDDRMRVCKMLYENNLFCFNVNQGLKEF